MLGAFYTSIVFKSAHGTLLATPTNEACRSCHPDWRTVSPTGDLKIPHRAHVVVLKAMTGAQRRMPALLARLRATSFARRNLPYRVAAARVGVIGVV
jgi:hypothetical protein